jgi:hypothetical protein
MVAGLPDSSLMLHNDTHLSAARGGGALIFDNVRTASTSANATDSWKAHGATRR